MWNEPRVGKIKTGIDRIIGQGQSIDRNYRLGVLNGWFVALGDAFFNATIVLSSFAAKLGAPNWIIGLLPSLLNAGALVPQAFIAPYVARLPVKVTLYRRVALLRISGLALIAASSFLFGHRPDLLLACFLLGLALNGLFTGLSSLPFWETVSKTIPQERRAAFFGIRNLVGGLLAFLAGFVVRGLLATGLAFPLPYALLFTFGTLAFATGWYLFGQVNEPPEPGGPQLRISLTIPFKDFVFRRFLRVRAMLALASMAEPFYAAYAVRVLRQTSEVGLYLTLYALSSVLSNLLWVRIAQHYGSRPLILVGGALGTLTPILALLLPAPSYGLVFVLQGAYLAALGLGTTTYLLNAAPAEHRSSYIGLANTLVGIVSFSPVLGGLLADWQGYAAPLLLASGFYAWALYAGRKLKSEV
ncbi:MFS transporter [Allomeiothermus silvanus]|uniref:MFS transporter n=1 Tax=Allomeiothermus silvanus TaxID=52022 RepID=UPI0023F228ED|nr:MFS transporter [Allomeiothermus silvanus]